MKKPGVNRSVHLFAAPMLWTTIGCLLMFRGVNWLEKNHFFFTALALLAGSLKSLFILDKTAVKSVARLVEFEDGRCLGAVYSWKTWLLILFMMISGIIVRTMFSPGTIIGTMYIAIGWALFFSSRHGWVAWLRNYR